MMIGMLLGVIARRMLVLLGGMQVMAMRRPCNNLQAPLAFGSRQPRSNGSRHAKGAIS